ncbi:hypothetical protein ACFLTH_04540 [Bacteroidota bacterium]
MKLSAYFSFLISAVLLMTSVPLFSQSHVHDDEHGEAHHAHGDHQHEVGVSLGATYLEHDEAFAPIIHLHYSKRLGEDDLLKHFGIGVGLETIIFEEMHYNVMGVLNVYPSGGLEISISPGILFIEEDDDYTSAFSFHTEIGYAFDFGFVEAGPVIGASFSGDDKHYSIGIHFGKGF